MKDESVKQFKKIFLKYKIVIVGILIIILGTVTWYISGQHKRTVLKAQQQFNSGNYKEALNIYSTLEKKYPKDVEVKTSIAETYYVMENDEKCDEYISKAQESLEESKKTEDCADRILILSLLRNNKKVLTGEENNINSIITLGEKYLKKYGDDKNIIKAMLEVYGSGNKRSEANELLKKYKVDEKSAKDNAEISSMYMSLGDMESSVEYLKKAYKIQKSEMKIYDVISMSYHEDESKLKDYILELKTKDDNAMYDLWLARIYSLNKDTAKEVFNIIKEAEKKDPSLSKELITKIIKINAYGNLNDTKEGESLLSETMKSYKDDYRVSHTAAWFYYLKGDYEKAKKYTLDSITLNPNYADNYGYIIPQIYDKMKDKNTINYYFYMAQRLEPYNNSIYSNAGYYYWYEANDSLRAIEYLTLSKALKPERDNLNINYDISMIYLANNNFKRAIEILSECIKIDNSIKYHRTLGTIYAQSGKQQQALEEINTCLSLEKNDIKSLNNLACYYLNMEGKLDKALDNIKKAKALMNDSMDEDVKKTIDNNYNKINNLLKQYNTGADNAVLELPNLDMFY